MILLAARTWATLGMGNASRDKLRHYIDCATDGAYNDAELDLLTDQIRVQHEKWRAN